MKFVEFTDKDGEPIWINRHRVTAIQADPDEPFTRLWMGTYAGAFLPVRESVETCRQLLEEKAD